MHKLFVYGTLKNGFTFYEDYLGGDKSNFLGNVVTSSDYSLWVGAQPHLVRDVGDKPVKGELYEVTAGVLASIDGLEGHPVVYKREIIDIYNEQGQKLLAWAYLRPKNFNGKSQCFRETEYV